MNEVTVKKVELIEIISKNRDNHRGEFLNAQEGFKATIVEELEKRLEMARQGKKINQYLSLPEPQDHTKEYDTVLSMLKMSVDDNVVIAYSDYAKYVLDDWSWKEAFASTASLYNNKRFTPG